MTFHIGLTVTLKPSDQGQEERKKITMIAEYGPMKKSH